MMKAKALRNITHKGEKQLKDSEFIMNRQQFEDWQSAGLVEEVADKPKSDKKDD